MSTLKGTTMHPRCRPIGACWDLLEWFQLFSTSQNTSQKSISELFWKKKNLIFWFPWYSTREDLSIDVSITNVGLILTKLRWFLFIIYLIIYYKYNIIIYNIIIIIHNLLIYIFNNIFFACDGTYCASANRVSPFKSTWVTSWGFLSPPPPS